MNFLLDAPGFGYNATRIFSILYCSAIFISGCIRFRWHTYLYRLNTRIPGFTAIAEYQQHNQYPPRVCGYIPVPRLGETSYNMVGAFFQFCVLMVILNFHPKFFLLLAFFSYFPYFSYVLPFETKRKTNQIPFIFLILSLAPDLDRSFATPTVGWPLHYVKVLLAVIYFFSGYSKLSSNNFSLKWFDGKTFAKHCLNFYLSRDHKPAATIAGTHLKLSAALSISGFLWEILFPIILFYPVLTIPFALAGLGFHIGTMVVTGINFLQYFGYTYFVFVAENLGYFFNGS